MAKATDIASHRYATMNSANTMWRQRCYWQSVCTCRPLCSHMNAGTKSACAAGSSVSVLKCNLLTTGSGNPRSCRSRCLCVPGFQQEVKSRQLPAMSSSGMYLFLHNWVVSYSGAQNLFRSISSWTFFRRKRKVPGNTCQTLWVLAIRVIEVRHSVTTFQRCGCTLNNKN